MRAVESIWQRNFLINLAVTKGRYDTALNQVTSGKKLINFSDNPSDAASVLSLKNQSDQITQFDRNIAAGLSLLQPAETAVNSSLTLIYRAISLAEQGASEQNTGQAREILADNVDQLRDQLLNYANSEVAGKFLFAGSNTLTTPYVKDPLSGVVTYPGNGEEVRIQADFSVQATTNVPGNQIFSGPIDVFQRLAVLRDALRADDTATIAGSISTMGEVVEQFNQALGVIGNSSSHLMDIRGQLKSFQTSLMSRISTLEDADLASAISNLSKEQTGLQATLNAGSRIQPNSLMDYMT